MRRFNSIILSSVSFAALAATPAYAQVAQTQSDQSPPQTLTTEQEIKSGQNACQVTNGQPVNPDCTPATTNTIVVTGSRIRSPNLQSPLPVTSVGGQEFFQTGDVSVGDKLAELPQVASSFTQANSTRFLGTAGLNLLDLRGLGVSRTLVLVNGRRHVGGDVLNTGVGVDVNTIPTDLIDRVDIVTGGNSAVYGSDAIAGVVNFVLKDHYDGFQLRGQGGQSDYGDADSYFISALIGKNFADSRGNIAVNLEYARRDQAFGDNRPWFYNTLTQVDSDPGSAVNGSDGIPDFALVKNFRNAGYAATGLFRARSGQCGADTLGVSYYCTYIFQPNGTLVPETGTRVGIGPTGAFVGGNGEDFVHGHQIQVTPQLDRYNVNLIGHYEITPAIVPFIEGTYSRTKSLGAGSGGAAFLNGGAYGDLFANNGGYNREAFSLNGDPFLTDQARSIIRSQIVASGRDNCSQGPLSSDEIAAIQGGGDTRFCVREVLNDLGFRQEAATRTTYRIVGGIRGDFGNDWNYEISGNYGQLKEKTKVQGNLNLQRFFLANDAVKDPATGKIVCRSQIDPSAAFGAAPWVYQTIYGYDYHMHDPNVEQRLQNDIAQCTPINPLGGQFTDAQRAYLLQDTTSTGKISQLDFTAFISGDSSKWFQLPGGPVGVVLGAEYREDNLHFQEDPLIAEGYTFYNAIPTFTAPKSKVKEAFGELRLPILKDLPFAKDLEISGAARVSDYSTGNTGTVWAYNANAIWSPFAGLRLRGNYARAVRAPNQVELFTQLGQNYTPGNVTDPCDVNQVGSGSQYRAANCAAAGIPAGTAIEYSGSIPFLSGGNPTLAAEKSDSWTYGGVLTPTLMPGFSLSVDYYNIRIKDVITAPTAQQVFNACYDLPSLNNPFCALFQRAGASGTGGQAGPYSIVGNSLHLGPQNYAQLRARGIDVEVAYRHQLGSIGRLDTKLTWSHALELTQFIDPTNPAFGDRLLGEIGDASHPAAPQDAFNWNTSLQHGPFTFGYQMRFIGKMAACPTSQGGWEATHGFEGRTPTNADCTTQQFYPNTMYHDVRFGWDVGPKYNFYLGVDNLTNKQPPYGASGIGGGTAIYDAIGRFFYAGVVAKFK